LAATSAAGSDAPPATTAMSKPREEAVAAPLPDGDVLIAGGESPPNGGILNDAELFDPATRTFLNTGVGSMTAARGGAAAAPLANGDVLIVGGFDGRDLLSSAELFDPKTLQFSSQGVAWLRALTRSRSDTTLGVTGSPPTFSC
jgi:hypothetical protein